MQIKQWLKGLQAIWPLLHLQHPAFTASYYSYSSILEALYYPISKDSLVVFVQFDDTVQDEEYSGMPNLTHAN